VRRAPAARAVAVHKCVHDDAPGATAGQRAGEGRRVRQARADGDLHREVLRGRRAHQRQALRRRRPAAQTLEHAGVIRLDGDRQPGIGDLPQQVQVARGQG
jgi:hypothetical protein